MLDIGCGPGRNAAHLTRYLNGGSYEGFDVMPEAIDSAKRRITPRYPNFRFQLLDLMNATYNSGGAASAADVRFPYPDESFDVVFAVSVYTHLRPLETERYLRETARVLKPGGRTTSTFFLLSPESLELLERHPERQRLGRSGPVLLTHELTDERGWRFRVRDPEHPEREVALYEDDARAMHEHAGLPVSDIRGGHWCGREQRADNFGHDLIVATKPGPLEDDRDW